jgi:hypothetical protein
LFILSLAILDGGFVKMKRRISREEFTRIYNAIWETGPTIQYMNPDSRLNVNAPGRLF